MKPVPNSKARRIIERLNALGPEEAGNNFLLRRLEQETRGALGQDPVSGYSALRMIATLRFDETQMRAAAQQVIKLSEYNSPDARLEFSYALRSFGFLLEASEQADKASRAAPRNAVATEVAARFAFYAGCVRRSSQLINRYSSLRPDVTLPYAYMVERLENALEHAQLSDEDFSGAIESAVQVIRNAQVWPLQMSHSGREEASADVTRFVLRVRVNAKQTQARLLEQQIAEVLDSHAMAVRLGELVRVLCHPTGS